MSTFVQSYMTRAWVCLELNKYLQNIQTYDPDLVLVKWLISTEFLSNYIHYSFDQYFHFNQISRQIIMTKEYTFMKLCKYSRLILKQW